MSRRRGPGDTPLSAMETLARQVEAIIEYYGGAEAAAERVGVHSSTLYDALRRQQGFSTRTLRRIEEAYVAVARLKRAGVGVSTVQRYAGQLPPAPQAPPVEEPVAPQPIGLTEQGVVVAVDPASGRVEAAVTPPERPPGYAGWRTCEVCERVLHLSAEHFYADPRRSDGFEMTCRRCSRRLRDRVQKMLERERYAREMAAVAAEPATPEDMRQVADALGALSEELLGLAIRFEGLKALVEGRRGG